MHRPGPRLTGRRYAPADPAGLATPLTGQIPADPACGYPVPLLMLVSWLRQVCCKRRREDHARA